MSEIKREILRSQTNLLDDAPDNSEGSDGQRTYRRVGGDINQYIKRDGEWVLLATTATQPSEDVAKGIKKAVYRIIQSDSELTVNEHHDLSGLGDDDHAQYLRADGSRALAGAWDMGSQNLTNVNIDSGTIDSVTLGTNSAVTQAQVDNINIDGNAITSTNTDGNIDLTPDGTGEVNISKVDIDSGAIDAVTLGTNSAVTEAQIDNININGNSITTQSGQITLDGYTGISLAENGDVIISIDTNKDVLFGHTGGTTSDPDVEFDGYTRFDGASEFDGTVQIDGNLDINSTSVDIDTNTYTLNAVDDISIDTDGDIILDADGGSVILKNGGVEALRLNLGAIPNISATGNFVIDGDSDVSIDADSGIIYMMDNKINKLKFTNSTGDWTVSNETSGKIIDIHVSGSSMLKMSDAVYIGGYVQTLYTPYKVHSKSNKNHFTTGYADYEENYSMIAEHYVSADYNTGYGS